MESKMQTRLATRSSSPMPPQIKNFYDQCSMELPTEIAAMEELLAMAEAALLQARTWNSNLERERLHHMTAMEDITAGTLSEQEYRTKMFDAKIQKRIIQVLEENQHPLICEEQKDAALTYHQVVLETCELRNKNKSPMVKLRNEKQDQIEMQIEIIATTKALRNKLEKVLRKMKKTQTQTQMNPPVIAVDGHDGDAELRKMTSTDMEAWAVGVDDTIESDTITVILGEESSH